MDAFTELSLAMALCQKRPELTAAAALETITTRGLPLKNSELRRCFNVYIGADKYLKRDGTAESSRTIAARFGKSHCTILRWMLADAPHLYARYYRKGSGHARP
jgi:hypothetical protein